MEISDRPGGIAELTRTISDVGVSIKDIGQDRAWVRTGPFSVGVCDIYKRKSFLSNCNCLGLGSLQTQETESIARSCLSC